MLRGGRKRDPQHKRCGEKWHLGSNCKEATHAPISDLFLGSHQVPKFRSSTSCMSAQQASGSLRRAQGVCSYNCQCLTSCGRLSHSISTFEQIRERIGLFVVHIAMILAGKDLAALEKIEQRRDRIRDVESTIAVGVTANKGLGASPE